MGRRAHRASAPRRPEPDGPGEGEGREVRRLLGLQKLEPRAGEQEGRDYYFVETRRGEVLWVYYDRRRRGWFLHGRVE